MKPKQRLIKGGKSDTCDTCKGKGIVELYMPGHAISHVACPHCFGKERRSKK